MPLLRFLQTVARTFCPGMVFFTMTRSPSRKPYALLGKSTSSMVKMISSFFFMVSSGYQAVGHRPEANILCIQRVFFLYSVLFYAII